MLNAKELREEYGPMIDQFLEECCEGGNGIRVRRLYSMYISWACERPGTRIPGRINFDKWVKQKYIMAGNKYKASFIGISERPLSENE